MLGKYEKNAALVAGRRGVNSSHPFAFDFTHAVTRAILWPVSRLWVFGREHLEPYHTGACLVAANHISHFDAFPLAHALGRRVDYLAAAEFFHPVVIGPLMRGGGAIPFNRARPGVRPVREILRRLWAGRMVGIFPEGGLRAGAASVLEGAPIRARVGRLATLGRTPVVPAVILGTDRLYDAHRWRLRRARTPIWVGFGPAIQSGEWTAPGASADLLGLRMRELYTQMKAEFHLQPADLPMTPQRRMAHW